MGARAIEVSKKDRGAADAPGAAPSTPTPNDTGTAGTAKPAAFV
jgi:hypothetical protein